MTKQIFITDLDGTLLDARDYSFAAAGKALAALQAQDIPLVLCSSKTRAEIEALRIELGNKHPFISENGGGIFIPDDYFDFPFEAESAGSYRLIRLGKPYPSIREQFTRLRDRLHAHVRGFADMSVAEVAVLTGLSEQAASLAIQRDFDEPFVFEDAVDGTFLHAIEAEGLHWTQGRIFHIMGDHDKGRAVHLLLSLYRRRYGAITSTGLGDAYNDLPLLEAVDRPILVRHEDGGFDERVNLSHAMRTQQPGPAGWNEAVLQCLANTHATTDTRHHDHINIFDAALAAVDPGNAVLNAMRIEQGQLRVAGHTYGLDKFERILVTGAGKATARMAQAVESLLGDRINAGLIIVKHGHSLPLTYIEQIEAAHPVPDETGLKATQRILHLAQTADEKTLVICLLSGGASALMVAPVADVSLEDKQQATRLLLKAGATINEMNAVRKHLSAVKGGQLARAVHPAQLLTLIVSDVIGDPLDVIASGPTSADNSTYADAWSVIEKYGLSTAMTEGIVSHLKRGMSGQAAETAKENDVSLKQTRNIIVASLRQALEAAAGKAGQLGYAVKTLTDSLQGEASEAARFLAQTACSELDAMQPGERRCLLCGGETTVTVCGNGKGGRNQELALVFALETAGRGGISLLSAGTDGTDGPTDAAGAIVNGDTAALAQKIGLDMHRFLADNDSYTFFRMLDEACGTHSHFKTGPTGTNVMDMQIVLLEKPE